MLNLRKEDEISCENMIFNYHFLYSLQKSGTKGKTAIISGICPVFLSGPYFSARGRCFSTCSFNL